MIGYENGLHRSVGRLEHFEEGSLFPDDDACCIADAEAEQADRAFSFLVPPAACPTVPSRHQARVDIGQACHATSSQHQQAHATDVRSICARIGIQMRNDIVWI